MDFNKVLDLPVVNVEKGSRTGVVEDVLIDKNTKKVKYLLVSPKRIFGEKRLVPTELVMKVSDNAVSISGEEGVRLQKRGEELPFLISYKNQICRKEVFSSSGKRLGRVDDGLFDMETGLIASFTVSDGFLQDLISGRKRVKEIDDIIGDGK